MLELIELGDGALDQARILCEKHRNDPSLSLEF